MEVLSRFSLWCDFLNNSIQNNFCKLIGKNLSIIPKSVESHQYHAIRHSICFFYHNNKDNKRNLCQDLLTIENTDSDLKVNPPHYANELLVRVRLPFQKLLQTRSTCRNNTKTKIPRKRVMTRISRR